MLRSIVLSVLGPDRTGLVELLARVVASHGGNWLESRLARLAGQFTGIVHLHVPSDRVDPLRADLEKLREQGLTVTSFTAIADRTEPSSGRHLRMELLGHDRAGIVRDISQALAAEQVNVIELETEIFSAPMSGDMMFRAIATLSAPSDLDLDRLGGSLRAIAGKLDLELDLELTIR